MRSNFSKRKTLEANTPAEIEPRTLRAFASGIADLCCTLRLVEFDIVCRFIPRERPEYATIETRYRSGGVLQRAEDVIAIPLPRNTFET
jgi:hypothetical protein